MRHFAQAPYPVTTGFTAGIAVVIATGQVKDFLGLTGVERILGDLPITVHRLR